ncbi:RICIN domain-containing protein [Flavobacteriaceae bacterium SZ-1-7]|uniref:RICIN domain-containing protein n=1 Tax=Tamlana sedimenti TaxID=3134126 RepID=UPI0031211E9F
MLRKITIKFILAFSVLSIIGINSNSIQAQASTSDNLKAQPRADRAVPFDLTDTGVSKPIIWGLDLAWLSEHNLRRGIAFMGDVDVVRSSFMPTNPLNNGALQGIALTNTNLRINIIKNRLGTQPGIVLNSDHPSVDPSFVGNATNWSDLIQITAQMHMDAGLTVVTVSPFNEPDYSATGQGTINDFYNICEELKTRPFFTSENTIRVSGGNTLNNDVALDWYNFLKPAGLEEGNTHQLAGNFDNYAAFYQAVSANGDHATNDELHNVMEAMVGVEYGLQTGIWWGTAEYARGEFCKASDGQRLAYAEHRPNWTAASVYRHPNGKVQAFGGVSERQARPTNYAFLSKDRMVYYDGHGPQREYVIELPADPNGAYQTVLQRNAERVVNITWGEDIQPPVDGEYMLVNRNSSKVLTVGAGQNDGTNVYQSTYTGTTTQQFKVNPVPIDIGGDFSYYRIQPVSDPARSLDVNNFSLDNGANIHLWTSANGGNQQWYLEYAGDGWFYIRSRESALCIDVMGASTADNANVAQWTQNFQNNQQWRLLPVDADIEFDAPSNPAGLVATAQKLSIRLSWDANTEIDLDGYTIFRAESSGGAYNTIARNVTVTEFVDNTVTPGVEYFYKIKAVDRSLNRSGYSSEVSTTATAGDALVAHYTFDDDSTSDSSENLYHGAPYTLPSYVAGQYSSQALSLNGLNFVQLPEDIANHQEITIACWVYRAGNVGWQRLFDFGNGSDEYMFLSPRSSTGQLHFGIKKSGGVEQSLQVSSFPTGQWRHVAITISQTEGTKMYLDNVLVAEDINMKVGPGEFKPMMNYIGRSQWATDPLLNARVEDFHIYNYPLSPSEISSLFNDGTLSVEDAGALESLSLYPVPAKDELHLDLGAAVANGRLSVSIYDIHGRTLSTKQINENKTTLDISDLPAGMYLLKLDNGTSSTVKRFVVK